MPTLAPPGAPAPRDIPHLPPPPVGDGWLGTPAPLAVPPTPLLVALAAGVALVGDLALQAGFVGLAAALTFVAAAAALLRSGRIERRAARRVVLLAPLFGMWLAVRTSPWLLPFDVAAAVGLLVLGAAMARGGSFRDLLPAGLAFRACVAVDHLVRAPGLLRARAGARRPAPGAAGRWWPIVRGVLLALPVVLVLGGLLASADAVFASLFDVAVRGDRIGAHVIGFSFMAWWALGLLRLASAPDAGEPDTPTRWLGRTEATIVLGAVVLLFGLFVATQAVTAAGGAEHVLETAGLTQAEYARSGFFQLLWVAGLTVAGLLTFAHVVDHEGGDRARLRWLCAGVVGLAVAIVVVAVVRLDLYRDAYGWTMLRLSCTVFAVWLGAVLVLLGLALAGPPPIRRLGWFVPAAGAVGLVLLFGLNVANPEALVARHNLTRDAEVAVDTSYLVELSDDAVPTIAALLPTLEDREQAFVRSLIGCEAEDDRGWAGWNRAERRAAAARRDLCQA